MEEQERINIIKNAVLAGQKNPNYLFSKQTSERLQGSKSHYHWGRDEEVDNEKRENSRKEWQGEVLNVMPMCSGESIDVSDFDIQDEVQFLGTDTAEDIDEEDQDTGVSNQMKGVYK